MLAAPRPCAPLSRGRVCTSGTPTDLVGKEQVAHGVVVRVLHDGANHLQHRGDTCRTAAHGWVSPWQAPGEVPGPRAAHNCSRLCPAPHPHPTHSIHALGTPRGAPDHTPVPPAIMPTDFTVLMTGLDFLSGRMANFPGERKR